MPNHANLTREQFIVIAQQTQLTLCSNLLEADKLRGRPRVCETGFLPEGKTEPRIEAWVWDDGLCLVSPAIWSLLGGT